MTTHHPRTISRRDMLGRGAALAAVGSALGVLSWPTAGAEDAWGVRGWGQQPTPRPNALEGWESGPGGFGDVLRAAAAEGRPVLVSRGELVEIGGSFRIPDVIRKGGARLVEVGTTNRTRLADFEAALEAVLDLGLILKVHPSNFRIMGFTQQASREEILNFMDGKIAKWWMPDDVAFVDGIPHTAPGKILKTALRDQFKSYRFPNAAA